MLRTEGGQTGPFMRFRLLDRRWSDKTVIHKTALIVRAGCRFRWTRLHSGLDFPPTVAYVG